MGILGFGILEKYILGIWDFGKIYFGNLEKIYKIYVSNLELRFCYEMMKKYYVNWSVEGILYFGILEKYILGIWDFGKIYF